MREHYATNRRRLRFAKFANMRAAKERKRIDRLALPDVMPDLSHVPQPKKLSPLFVVTIRCRDGERVRIPIHETPWGLSVSATAVSKRVATVLREYRPQPAI